MATLLSRNPATGDILQEIQTTNPKDLPQIIEKARQAQALWQATPLRKRAKFLLQLRETLLDQADTVVDLLSEENGKPKYEAMIAEVIPSVDMLTYYAKRAPKLLKNRRIPLTLMKHRKSYLHYWPLGVVTVIAPWNYPFMLPFTQIIAAVVAGNAVLFKPSEVTPGVGLKIQELFNDAGLPPGLLQTLIGDGALGAEIIRHKPDKIFFTGSVATGKKVMAAASENLTPVVLELGGKDAMIVLPDADLDYATSAALWGGFTNSGQVCASTERLLLHERIADPFLALLKEKVAKLRQGPSAAQNNDLGPITFDKQRQIYATQIQQAKAQGAQFVAGGDFTADSRYLKPTIVTGPKIENLDIYNEETFGPVIAATTFKTVAEAIEKANRSRYGLLASVITRNLSLGEEIAKQLAVGTVTINEVAYTAGLGETPWGGIKESGFGRTHSDLGIFEFVNIRHIHSPRMRLFVFKSIWWFPYTPFQYQTARKFIELYRRNWIDKLRALPHVLWNLIEQVKKEARL